MKEFYSAYYTNDIFFIIENDLIKSKGSCREFLSYGNFKPGQTLGILTDDLERYDELFKFMDQLFGINGGEVFHAKLHIPARPLTKALLWCVNLSNFWQDEPLRRSFLTAVLKFYHQNKIDITNKETFYSSLTNCKYFVSNTRALRMFIDGYVHIGLTINTHQWQDSMTERFPDPEVILFNVPTKPKVIKSAHIYYNYEPYVLEIRKFDKQKYYYKNGLWIDPPSLITKEIDKACLGT